MTPHSYDFWLQPGFFDDAERVIDEAVTEVAGIRNRADRLTAIERRSREVSAVTNKLCQVVQERDGAPRLILHADSQFTDSLRAVLNARVTVKFVNNDERRRDAWRDIAVKIRESHVSDDSSWSSLLPDPETFKRLPDGSWALNLRFTLDRPYASKGTAPWHILDNPVAVEPLTGRPIVYPSTWKGHLNHAALMLETPRTVMERLFGDVDSRDGSRRGRLRVLPTYFSKAKLSSRVITPLRRSTRTPDRGPIGIEVMDEGSQGDFWLLYIPEAPAAKISLEERLVDVQATVAAVGEMMIFTGFSAKKAASWGVAETESLKGCLWTFGADWPPLETLQEAPVQPEPIPQPVEIELPDERYRELMTDDGWPIELIRNDQGQPIGNDNFRALESKPCGNNFYRRFRQWYLDNGEQWRAQRARALPAEPLEAADKSPERVRAVKFTGFDQIEDLLTNLQSLQSLTAQQTETTEETAE